MLIGDSFRIKKEVNFENLEYNFLKIKSFLPEDVKVMCVVKADAYGLGALKISKMYEKLGAGALAVANIDEALSLRKNKIDLPILILGYTPPCRAVDLHNFKITQTIFSSSYAKKINECAAEKDVKVDVHLKIDTGMSRLGFFFQNKTRDIKTLEEIKNLSLMKNINIKGIFTHFSSSDDDQKSCEDATNNQINNFNYVIDFSRKIFKNLDFVHCSNSGAILFYPKANNNYVRAGIILYGYYPSKLAKNKILLKEVLKISTVVVQIKEVPEGTKISYGGTFITKRKSKIATVPIGYADGLFRSLSNNGKMLINGQFAPIVGNICMDQCMLDVTDVKGVKEGDAVTVVGEDGNSVISVDDIAKLCGTINYEVLCNFKTLRSDS